MYVQTPVSVQLPYRCDELLTLGDDGRVVPVKGAALNLRGLDVLLQLDADVCLSLLHAEVGQHGSQGVRAARAAQVPLPTVPGWGVVTLHDDRAAEEVAQQIDRLALAHVDGQQENEFGVVNLSIPVVADDGDGALAVHDACGVRQIDRTVPT